MVGLHFAGVVFQVFFGVVKLPSVNGLRDHVGVCRRKCGEQLRFGLDCRQAFDAALFYYGGFQGMTCLVQLLCVAPACAHLLLRNLDRAVLHALAKDFKFAAGVRR